MINFLKNFIDFSAFQNSNTQGIAYSILNLFLLLAPIIGIIYLLVYVFRLMNAGSKAEKSMQTRNAVLRVLIGLIIAYVIYALARFTIDQIF